MSTPKLFFYFSKEPQFEAGPTNIIVPRYVLWPTHSCVETWRVKFLPLALFSYVRQIKYINCMLVEKFCDIPGNRNFLKTLMCKNNLVLKIFMSVIFVKQQPQFDSFSCKNLWESFVIVFQDAANEDLCEGYVYFTISKLHVFK